MISRLSLQSWASTNFRFGDLIAGETYRAVGSSVDLAPRQPDSWRMLSGLAQGVLEPLRAAFGAFEITYGFAPAALTARILATARRRRREGVLALARIAPRLDQHASCELRQDGLPICARGGAAVDLRVAGVSSLELATWCAENLPVDRLYFYEPSRPIHLSWAETPRREFYEMRLGASGRRVPRRFCRKEFAQ